MLKIFFKNIYKNDFPIFKINQKLVYLDSTATSLKPQLVIEKIREYYKNYSANIFRGVYKISEKATEEFEKTRQLVSQLINAAKEEIIFTRNTTESINLISYGLQDKINRGDEIVTTILEHHSNFVPWQQLAFKKKALLKVIDIKDDFTLELTDKDIEKIFNNKTKIFAITYVSNVLGTINPLEKIIAKVKEINPQITVVVDAAQAVSHLKIDVKKLNGDFLVFSSHKMFGPTGVGVLWGKKELLEKLPPFLYGGEMIEEVFLDKTTFKKAPYKFEAGTPAIGEVIGFQEAIKYLLKIGYEKIQRHEKDLTQYCLETLANNFSKKIMIFGSKDLNYRLGIISFQFSKYHPHDVAGILDEFNICVRAGHHCAMPLHQRLGVNGTVRSSFHIYNTKDDIDKLIKGLKQVERRLGK